MTNCTASPVSLTRTYSLFPSQNYATIELAKPDPKNETTFTPSEFKLGESRVTLNDIYLRAIFLAHHPETPEEIITAAAPSETGEHSKSFKGSAIFVLFITSSSE